MWFFFLLSAFILSLLCVAETWKHWAPRCGTSSVANDADGETTYHTVSGAHISLISQKLHGNKSDLHARACGGDGRSGVAVVAVLRVQSETNKKRRKDWRCAYINYPNMCRSNSWMHRFPVLLRAIVMCCLPFSERGMPYAAASHTSYMSFFFHLCFGRRVARKA